MLKMTETTIIPIKTAGAGVVLLSAVLMGASGDVAGVVGQLQVEGCCITTTPVNRNKIKLGHCSTMDKNPLGLSCLNF